MPYTMEDFRRDSAREDLYMLSADEILQLLSVDERLSGLSADEIRQLSPDKRRRLRQLLEAIDDE